MPEQVDEIAILKQEGFTREGSTFRPDFALTFWTLQAGKTGQYKGIGAATTAWDRTGQMWQASKVVELPFPFVRGTGIVSPSNN